MKLLMLNEKRDRVLSLRDPVPESTRVALQRLRKKPRQASRRDSFHVVTPSVFFLDVVPRLGRLRARAFPALGAKVCVVVDQEAFTLQLHEGLAQQGGDPWAQFQLFLTRAAFDRLIAGDLDVDDAIAKKHVGYRGDLRILQQLGRLIAGAGSSVDVRSAR